MLALTLYPDVVRRAHEDLDRVVGRDRMLSLADRPKLPYIEAIVKEVNRWRPVGPIGGCLVVVFVDGMSILMTYSTGMPRMCTEVRLTVQTSV